MLSSRTCTHTNTCKRALARTIHTYPRAHKICERIRHKKQTYNTCTHPHTVHPPPHPHPHTDTPHTETDRQTLTHTHTHTRTHARTHTHTHMTPHNNHAQQISQKCLLIYCADPTPQWTKLPPPGPDTPDQGLLFSKRPKLLGTLPDWGDTRHYYLASLCGFSELSVNSSVNPPHTQSPSPQQRQQQDKKAAALLGL